MSIARALERDSHDAGRLALAVVRDLASRNGANFVRKVVLKKKHVGWRFAR